MRIKGFTLIELLLYVSLIGILLSTVVAFFGTSMEARVKNESIAEVDQQGAAALEVIAHTIRNASSITSPATGATGSSLTLVVPTSSLSPTIFDLSSGVLRIKEGAAAVVPLTNSKVEVTNLTVKNLTRPSTPGAVQVSLTIRRVNNSGRNEYDYSKTFITTTAVRP